MDFSDKKVFDHVSYFLITMMTKQGNEPISVKGVAIWAIVKCWSFSVFLDLIHERIAPLPLGDQNYQSNKAILGLA